MSGVKRSPCGEVTGGSVKFRALKAIAVASTVFVAVGLLQYVQSDAAVAEESDSSSDAVLSLDALPGSPAKAETPTVPEGDFPAATPLPGEPKTVLDPAPQGKTAVHAERVDTSGLKVVGRSEESTTFERADGMRVQQISSSPINVKNSAGKWVEINTSLEEANGTWRVKDHPLSPMFGKGADSDKAVSVSRDGHDVSFSLMGAGAGRVESPFWFWDDRQKFAFRGSGMAKIWSTGSSGVR